MISQNLEGDELAFYESKLHTMKFFYHYEVVKTLGLSTRLTDNEVLTLAGEMELV